MHVVHRVPIGPKATCVVLTEYVAAAEVEIVATDALVPADLLPAQAHEPADSIGSRGGGV
jgi:hypothetical protein